MVFHDVPVVVADVVGADMTTLPGIIGMNLFTDRNLSIDPRAKRIYVSGQVSGPLAGDMNADGLVNGLDVDPFGLALSNPTAYRSLLPGLNPHVLGDINGDGELSELDAGLFSYLLAMGRILRGDMNADGVLNGLDVDPFVLALNDPWLYYGRYGGMDPNYLGDINGDGLLDLYDVDPFVELLMAGGVDPLTIGVITPEPGSAALLGGLMVLAWCGRRGRGVRGRMGSPQGPCT